MTETLTLKVERADASGEVAAQPILDVMKFQLDASMKGFAENADPAPYFISYQLTDRRKVSVVGTLGGLMVSSDHRTRMLDVDVRVGDHALDNTHPLRGDSSGMWAMFMNRPRWIVPLEDDPAMIRLPLWIMTDAQYKKAVEAYLKVKGNKAIKTEAEDSSDDFSREAPVRLIESLASVTIDRPEWEKRIRAYSELFEGHPRIYDSNVTLSVDVVTRYIVNAEGSMVQASRAYVRLSFMAQTRADDGMRLSRWDAIDVGSLDRMPDEAMIRARIEKVIADTEALREAPLVDSYVGPAILGGHAAGVYFHEIFGHRVEGHRQKDDTEGQTFAKKVGKQVMPEFINVYDDPTIRTLDGVDLNGHYTVDDEAVPTSGASLVEGGVLKGFLMSRSPTRGFDHSNGHGRRQEGNTIVARQGNLIVHPSRVTTADALKGLLIEEIERQKKDYGLRFTIVQGGFTNTRRYGFSAFKVLPVMVYRVYPDGREELVRGATIDGTPLASLTQIIAAGDDLEVFNGYCGAESGSVPVSAASPSLLVKKIEVSRAPAGSELPPFLPPPSEGPSGQNGGSE